MGGGATILGAAVRLAVDGLRGQRLRLRPGIRGVPTDRRAGAACQSRRGVRAVRRGSRRGCVDRGAARAVDGVSPQTSRDDRDGPVPVRHHDDHPARLRVRLARFRPTAGRIHRGRRRKDRVQRGQRCFSQGPRPARSPARRERPVRVHELEFHRRRAADRWCRDRSVRAGHDRRGRRRQLPALGAGYQRDPRPRRTTAAAREPGRRGRATRRLAAHSGPSRAPAALPQQHARRRTDHGHRAAAGRAPARPARFPTLAVRPRLRRALRRWTDRVPAGPSGRGPLTVRIGCSGSSARCARSR